MYKLLIYSMKRITIAYHFFQFQASQISVSEMILSDNLYRVFTLTAKAYTETLLKDGCPPSPSDNLYWVFTLTAKAYTETLLKDESPRDSPFNSLYWVFTLTAKDYTETILKYGIPLDGTSDNV